MLLLFAGRELRAGRAVYREVEMVTSRSRLAIEARVDPRKPPAIAHSGADLPLRSTLG